MLRIALVGRNKASKSWVGNWLKSHHGFEHKRLGDPASDLIAKLHYWDWHYGKKQFGWYQRMLLYDQIYKTEPDVWVKHMEHRLEQQVRDVVVSDVRYINELEYLRDKLGFKIVRVYAPMPRYPKISTTVGREAASGTLYLMETYGKDFTEKVRADHSIEWDHNNRWPAKDSLEILVNQWRNIDK